MSLPKVFETFVEGCAPGVMFCGVLQNILSDEEVDRIFREHACRQYEDELLFSTIVSLLAGVVLRQEKSVNAAYRRKLKEIGVAVKSVYNKLRGAEPQVCEALVAVTAEKLAQITEAFPFLADPLPGYSVVIVDCNHFPASQRRIKALREEGVAALPGQTMTLLNANRLLVRRVVACPDAHTNERRLLDPLLPHVGEGECWLGDRNLCVRAFLEAIDDARAFFVVRHHLGGCAWRPLGPRKKLGRVATGVVYEQQVEITRTDGRAWSLRRVTVVLDESTRDGETELHLLTNLPASVSGQQVANVYAGRWTIENAFQDIATALRGEINTLAYPGAALLCFCLAVIAFNVLSVVKAAIQRQHAKAMTAEAKPQPRPAGKTLRPAWKPKLSTYYLANDISLVHYGMMLVIPAARWRKAWAHLTPAEMARLLLELARHVNYKQYLTNPWTPKPKRRPRKPRSPPGRHQSTARTLAQAKK